MSTDQKATICYVMRCQVSSHVLAERVYWRHAPSPLRSPSTPNPNDLQHEKAIGHWLRLADMYTFPHVQYFDSAADLAAKLKSTDLRAVSASMGRYLHEREPTVAAKWDAVLRALFDGQPPGSWPSDGGGGGFDRELEARFHLQLPREEPDCNRLSAPELGNWN